jgi:hypothetical protein
MEVQSKAVILLVIGWKRPGVACEKEKICLPILYLSQFYEILQTEVALTPIALTASVK